MKWEKGTIDGVIIKPLRLFSDSRGWLAEIYRSDELPAGFAPEMSYISVTHPGEIRGPHEHIAQTDLFCFAGPGTFMVRLWDHRKKSPTAGKTMTLLAGADEPKTILIPYGVVHAYKNVSDVDAFCVNYPDKLYAGKNKKEPVDEIRHEDDVPQVYVF